MRHRLSACSLAWLLAIAPDAIASTPGTRAAPGDPSPGVEAARIHRAAHGAAVLREFAELLAVPNVASDSANIRGNADLIAARFTARGVQTRLLEIPGAPPVVFGRLDVPGSARTLGIYVHYDGQPAGTETWIRDPWSPALYAWPVTEASRPLPWPGPGDPIDPEWRVVARSAGDDKAPLAALLAALDALGAAGLAPTSSLVFFFEGEEEAGSPHLEAFFREYGAAIDVDAWLLCDGPVHQSRRPLLAFGVRGVAGLELTVYGPSHGLHSGHYGNWAPNPGLMLAKLLAGMKDDRGRVLIDGFYGSTRPLGPVEREALATVPGVEEALLEELGLAAPEGDRPLVESLLDPSLNLRGLRSGDVGRDARNVIPSTASASIDLRLAAGNDPDSMLDLVEAHIRKQGYFIVQDEPDFATRRAHPKLIRVVRETGYPAMRTAMDDPLVARLISAVGAASDDPVVLMPTLGGSLPLYLFARTWPKPVVIVPIANHDDNQHAPDENLRLANLWYGIDLFAAILTMP